MGARSTKHAATDSDRSATPGKTAYRQLSEEIVSGELAPGEMLVEAQLAARLGISRTPVREALGRLEQEGFVERYDRGLRVRSRSIEEILEIYEIRVELEVLAARAAARNRSEIDLMVLQRAHDQMAAVQPGEAGTMVEVNRTFHTALWRAGGNKTLADLLTRLNTQLQRYRSTTLSEPGRWEQAIREHEALVAAVRDRDAEQATAIAREHIESARDLRMAMYLDDAVS